QARGESHTMDTPFGAPSAPIVRTRWEGTEIAFLPRHGEGHLYPPSAVPFRANIFALKALGCTHIIASGATGSLREEIRPCDLVVPDQVIDQTRRRASSFFDEFGTAVHVEFSHPFCPTLRRKLLSVSNSAGTTVHDGGTYVCMEGPAFSTVAESRMHRAWGGDLIGMTCLPEAKLAREAEICYALVTLTTDYDCWRHHDESKDRHELLKQIMQHVDRATQSALRLASATVKAIGRDGMPACSCQTSLDLAIWSDLKKMPSTTAARLKPLLARRLAQEKN